MSIIYIVFISKAGTFLFSTSYYLMIKYKVEDTSEEEDNEVSMKSYIEKYDNYYQTIEKSRAIRPICITENVDFGQMSFTRKILWWLGTVFKVRLI